MALRLQLLDGRLPRIAQRYWWACRHAMNGHSDIGISMDASRMGKREVMFGLVTRPNGFASWLVPQANITGFATIEAHALSRQWHVL